MLQTTDFSTTNAQTSDEVLIVSDSNPVQLEHDTFFNKTGKLVVIATGTGGGGTVLTETTDYTIGGAIDKTGLPAPYQTSLGSDVVYSTVAITNATYHDTVLYISYYPIFDAQKAARHNELVAATKGGDPVEWNELTTYTAGQLVQRYGLHFTASGKASNLNKDPISPLNSLFWVPPPAIETLIHHAALGIPLQMGVHPFSDFNDSDYQNTLLLETATYGGTAYNFYGVAIDGDTVTGDATLVAILDPGGGNEYPHIDIWAPDNLGTRVLADAKGVLLRAIDQTGGMAVTLAERLEDAFQGHRQDLNSPNEIFMNGSGSDGAGSGSTDPLIVGDPITDGVNGTPRTGMYTRDKSITVGVPYIIVMIPA